MKRKEPKSSRVSCMKCNMRACIKAERSHYIIDHVNINIHDTLKKNQIDVH